MNRKRFFNFLLPVKPAGIQWFILTCAALKFLFVTKLIIRVLISRVNDYDLGEILLNYQQGFQRRSFVGTFIFAISKKPEIIDPIIKTINGLGMICLFVLIFNPVRRYTAHFIFLIAVIYICSPFGLSFYCDLWYKKEFLFFPLIALAMSSFNFNHTAIRYILLNGVIVAGCLINEAFVFLVLPFLIGVCYLNKQKPSHIISLLLTAFITVSLILSFSVKPEPAITNYMISMLKMGFDTTGDLTHPVRFMRMGLNKTIQFAAGHFKLSYTFMYLCLYFLNISFLFGLFINYIKNFREVFTNKVLVTLAIIHIGILPMLFLGMDYGRWFSFAFIISLLLITDQMRKTPLVFLPPRKSTAIIWIFFSLFYLFIHIPQMAAFNIYHPMDYANAFLTFLYRY